MLKPLAAGKGVKRKAEEAATPTAPAGSEHFAWLELPASAAFVSEGLPAKVPLVPHDKQKKAFQMAHGMLQELLGATMTEEEGVGDVVTFEHDTDGDVFPEVMQAVSEATGEATSFCVARCAKLGKWAVGTGYGWKTREVAAKLALAIAIAEDTGELQKWVQEDGEFGQFCVTAGLIEVDALPEGAKGTGALQYPVYGLALQGSSTLVDRGMAATAPAVVHDTDFAGCFSCASPLLSDLIGAGAKDIVFEHDTEGETFPEIKKAITDAGGEENCFCVAICKEANIWAVGIGAGWKNREKAAKVALALALADDQNTFTKCIEKYRDFALLCVSAELITKDRVPAQRKEWSSGSGWGGGGGDSWGEDASCAKGKGKGKDGKDWDGKGAKSWEGNANKGWDGKGCKSWDKGGKDWEGGKGCKSWDKGGQDWGGGKGWDGDKGGNAWGGGKGGGEGGGGKSGKMEKLMAMMSAVMGKGDGW